VRLTKTPPEYLETRDSRRELPYEAMLANGRPLWRAGDRIRVYRTRSGAGGVIDESEDDAGAVEAAGVSDRERRDYDVNHYTRLLRETFAVRLARAFTPGDYEAVFGDPDQMSLFAPPVGTIRTVLLNAPGNTVAAP
jgi:hypothetical protein